MKKTISVLFILLILVSCQKKEDNFIDLKQSTAEVNKEKSTNLHLSSDFQLWLQQSNYAQFNFVRNDIENGSFGGRDYANQPITHQPVIFIHGNSDKAYGDITTQTGWKATREYFISKGYTNAELYAFTWGPANALLSAQQYHSYEYLSEIRAFIQAVKEYTGATKVDIISHSMGVTLARKAIKGGTGNDIAAGGAYNLGSALTLIDAFVGIAGANRGLVSCYLSGGIYPTCSNTNGLYPGYLYYGFGPYGVSNILVDMNSTSKYEGAYVYSIWSTVDEIIGYGNLVYGKYTSQIPGQKGEKVYTSVPYGHYNLKDLTQSTQYNMVVNHTIN
jgi:hypothetical protein